MEWFSLRSGDVSSFVYALGAVLKRCLSRLWPAEKYRAQGLYDAERYARMGAGWDIATNGSGLSGRVIWGGSLKVYRVRDHFFLEANRK